MKNKSGTSISVVINTLNEEKNLPYVLRSVCDWADEIIVVDMHSDDRTVDIAKQYGATVFNHERKNFVEPARQFAIEQAASEWVLILDADELVPEPLSRKFMQIISNDEIDVVLIPRLNYLLGKPLMHTGWSPCQDKHHRLFRKNKLITSSTIHSTLEPVEDANILELNYAPGLAIVHFNYLDSTHFIEKLNRYTSIEAQQSLERGEKHNYRRMFFSSAKIFVNRFIKNKGYKDGWRGLYLSLLMVFYRVVTNMKLKELETIGDGPQIESHYHAEAERFLADYGKASE